MSIPDGDAGVDDRAFGTAQFCLNGHLITRALDRFPAKGEKHCRQCGELTITACQECKAEIRGEFRKVTAPVWAGRPAFCHECGEPYLWTSKKLEAATTYALNLPGFTSDEKMQLALSIDDLVKNSPTAEISASRFKGLVNKAGQEAAAFFKIALRELLVEQAKKWIWG